MNGSYESDESPQISQISADLMRKTGTHEPLLPHLLAPLFPYSKNLCKSGTRERSRWEANNTDGEAERPSERERASQSVDRKPLSVSSVPSAVKKAPSPCHPCLPTVASAKEGNPR